MPGESQLVPKSSPDPTVMTTEQLDRGLRAERDYVDLRVAVIEQRITGMDLATEVLQETVTRVPTDLQQAIGHEHALTDERFSSVALQFAERDTRTERESRDNTTKVDAAFAAQKDSAAKQDDSNQKAIDKSERATADAISKLGDLFESRTRALDEKIVDIQRRQDRQEATKAGGLETQGDSRYLIGLIITIIVATAIVAGFVLALAT